MALFLKEWLKATGRTQESYGKEIGRDKVRVNHYCTGKITIPYDVIMKTFEISGGMVTPDSIYLVTPEMINEAQRSSARTLKSKTKKEMVRDIVEEIGEHYVCIEKLKKQLQEMSNG